jgi:RNA polymerase sigma-70 factor, ECF subfamily
MVKVPGRLSGSFAILTMKKISNDKVLTEAHRDFARGLSRYAHLKISDLTLGDDLVQATFMKTWIYLEKKGQIDLMRAFLYHVLNDLIVDEYRRNKPISLDILLENDVELGAINSEHLFNLIDGKTITALIQKLPQKYRAVITMRYVEELSLKEMSALTNESENAMSVQIHRGLAKLKLLSTVAARPIRVPLLFPRPPFHRRPASV